MGEIEGEVQSSLGSQWERMEQPPLKEEQFSVCWRGRFTDVGTNQSWERISFFGSKIHPESEEDDSVGAENHSRGQEAESGTRHASQKDFVPFLQANQGPLSSPFAGGPWQNYA